MSIDKSKQRRTGAQGAWERSGERGGRFGAQRRSKNEELTAFWKSVRCKRIFAIGMWYYMIHACSMLGCSFSCQMSQCTVSARPVLCIRSLIVLSFLFFLSFLSWRLLHHSDFVQQQNYLHARCVLLGLHSSFLHDANLCTIVSVRDMQDVYYPDNLLAGRFLTGSQPRTPTGSPHIHDTCSKGFLHLAVGAKCPGIRYLMWPVCSSCTDSADCLRPAKKVRSGCQISMVDSHAAGLLDADVFFKTHFCGELGAPTTGAATRSEFFKWVIHNSFLASRAECHPRWFLGFRKVTGNLSQQATSARITFGEGTVDGLRPRSKRNLT